MKDEESTRKNWSRRHFLGAVGAGVPTLSLMVGAVDVQGSHGSGLGREYAQE